MFNFLSTIPNAILVITSVIIGFVALYGIFDRQFRERIKERNKERDALEDRIRALYKEELQAQEEKINELNYKVVELEKHLDKISAENKLMKEFIQGRDKATIEYQKQGISAMKVVKHNGRKLDKVIEGLIIQSTNIERLAVAIEKHFDVPEKIITQTKQVKTRRSK